MTLHRFPDAPARIRDLRTDQRGFPVPWFVAWIDGKPDFRVIEHGKIGEALRHDQCWLCGQRLGAYKAFVIGPMCAINRVSSEPPCHLECAEFAAQACPFLTQPKMRRNDKGLPESAQSAPGIPLDRNPGVALIWSTKRFRTSRVDHGVLFDVGEPDQVRWFAEGRPATRDEVLTSITSGLNVLLDAAMSDGPPAVAELRQRLLAVAPLLPVAA